MRMTREQLQQFVARASARDNEWAIMADALVAMYDELHAVEQELRQEQKAHSETHQYWSAESQKNVHLIDDLQARLRRYELERDLHIAERSACEEQLSIAEHAMSRARENIKNATHRELEDRKRQADNFQQDFQQTLRHRTPARSAQEPRHDTPQHVPDQVQMEEEMRHLLRPKDPNYTSER